MIMRHILSLNWKLAIGWISKDAFANLRMRKKKGIIIEKKEKVEGDDSKEVETPK